MANFGSVVTPFLASYLKKMLVLGLEEAPNLLPVVLQFVINQLNFGTNILLAQV
jgi:hypothetical protein